MTTIARPYATAAFEYALANNDLPAWAVMLQSAVTMTNDASVAALLASPTMTNDQLADLYGNVLQSQLDTPKKNFIGLLAESHRLSALPDIFSAFQALLAAQEKTIAVTVTSAVALDAAYQQKLTAALTKRLQQQVELECKVDPALLGGAIVRAGDMVIDGSVRGKLARMIEFI